jgi:hypothetical protein
MDRLIAQIPDTILYTAGALAIGIWFMYGVLHPLLRGGNFASTSASIHPKLQYSALAIASVAFGSSGHVGGWLATGREWITTGFSKGTEYAFGFSFAGLALAVLIFVWIDFMVPGGLEPSGRPIEHFGMWAVSLMLWPMLTTVSPTISTTIFTVVFIARWVWNKKQGGGGGSRSMAGAGAGGGRF